MSVGTVHPFGPLRLVPQQWGPPSTAGQFFEAVCGTRGIGSVFLGSDLKGQWTWSITRIHDSDLMVMGKEPSREEAAAKLGAVFRRWLEKAGLEETDDPTPQDGPSFTLGCSCASKLDCGRDLHTPSGLKVGFVARYSQRENITHTEHCWWGGHINKFHDAWKGQGAYAQTQDEAVEQLARGFRIYIASMGLRERLKKLETMPPSGCQDGSSESAI